MKKPSILDSSLVIRFIYGVVGILIFIIPLTVLSLIALLLRPIGLGEPLIFYVFQAADSLALNVTSIFGLGGKHATIRVVGMNLAFIACCPF